MYFYRIDQTISQNQFGGKASRLAFLAQHGYPVPDAVFLSAQSYFDFLKQNAIFDNIQSLHLQSKQKQLEQAETIRRLLLQKPFPSALRSELEQITAYFKNPVSVRSSGLEEDSEKRSFAGQYNTVLHVEPTTSAIGQAIRQVWASQWKPGVISYRIQNRLPVNDGMGIVIQTMLNPDFAGVAFSNNPLKQEQTDRIIFEFVEGLGIALVDGTRTPQSITWDIRKRNWLNAQGLPSGFTKPFKQLAEKIQDLDAEFKSPVDVEWAIEANRFWLLQVRPVTGAEKIIEWTNENVAEVIPDVITPYTWSVLGPVTNSAFARLLRFLGIKHFPEEGLFGLFKGKVYFNNTAFNHLLSRFYIGEQLRDKGLSSVILYLVRLIPAAFHLLLFLIRLEKKIRRHLDGHPQILNGLTEESEQDPKLLLKSVENLLQLHHETMFLHVAGTIFAELYFQLLDKLCNTLLPSESGISAWRLLTGTKGAESAESGRALWEIAELIRANKTLSSVFDKTSAENLAEKLKALPEAESVRRAIENFLIKFGHGALHEFELIYPRWREDPHYIYASLKNMLTHISEPDWNDKEEQRGQKQKKLLRQTKRQIALPVRPLFGFVARKAEFFGTQRENLKQAFIKAHFVLKKKLLKLATELNLETGEDIFFLKQDEIAVFVNSAMDSQDVAETIRQRRTEREIFLNYNHPRKIRQIGKRKIPVGEIHTVQGDLSGIPCSTGIVEGTAKIILNPETTESLPEGSIIIARSANPGWTPLFVTAAGVITEVGGALSHSAIIAREYGLPMIAAVPDVTGLIKDGQRIRMDGEKGLIEVL